MNQSGGNFTNFENSQKIEKKSYGGNFFAKIINTEKSFISI